MRLGVASYGECGPGEDETTTEEPSTCSGREENTRCYPTSTSFTEVPAGCVNINVVIPQIPVEIPAFGTLEATWRNGLKNGLSPSEMVFEEGVAGALASAGTGSGQTSGSIFGVITVVGDPQLQLITLK